MQALKYWLFLRNPQRAIYINAISFALYSHSGDTESIAGAFLSAHFVREPKRNRRETAYDLSNATTSLSTECLLCALCAVQYVT